MSPQDNGKQKIQKKPNIENESTHIIDTYLETSNIPSLTDAVPLPLETATAGGGRWQTF